MVKQGDGSQVKIREKKVKIQFTKLDGDGDAGANGTTHKVAGQGSNKYGAFVLDGTYDSNTAVSGWVILASWQPELWRQ